MSTHPSTAEFLLDQLAATGNASVRRMFGEYCLYLAGKPVGLVCDNQLFLKPTDAGKAVMPQPVEGFPFPSARAHWCVTADQWEDAPWLCQLIQATAGALPEPKAKAPRKPRSKTTK
ncbi:TfoX/Sxy family protein [Rhodoferax sp.]|uniref:TfoX/Sxy family protein n=1 Tax=Rhodoferax sp. TaxID=50421 RepID=UPI0025F0C010|nr:TfoX/Sxy family protein [Rhodoferax sp.]